MSASQRERRWSRGGGGEARFARAAHAHTHRNTGINAVLERCGSGGRNKTTASALRCAAASAFLTASASSIPSLRVRVGASAIPPLHALVLRLYWRPLLLATLRPPLRASRSHCGRGCLLRRREGWWRARVRDLRAVEARDGRRSGRSGAGAEARRAGAAPRQGPAPRRLLLRHQPSPMAGGNSSWVPTLSGHAGNYRYHTDCTCSTDGREQWINTLLQSFFGTRLPAVIGGSYTFVLPTISIILAGRYANEPNPHTKFLRIMRGTQGALIVASALQIIVGFSGLWRNVARYLSPLSAAPLVALVGFGLYELGFPSVAKCVEIGLPELILLVIFAMYLPHAIHMLRSIFDRFAVLFTIPIVWLYAYLLTVGGAYRNAPPKTQFHCRTDRSGLIGGAPWIRVPYPFQWGAPTFDAGEAFAMMAASFVALVESTGAFIAISRYASATPLPPSVLSRGIGWQGIGILLDGLFGTGNGSSVSIENAGLLALTRVGSRRVVQISAGFMIFFSILGKFGAVFASIPAPIFAALYCVFFAYVGSAGLGFLQFCNLNSFRTKFILGLSVFLGLSIPQYFNEYTSVAGYGPVHTRARWFNDIVNVIFSSKAFVAAFVAYLLDNTIHRHESSVRKDRGYHWWDKFRSYKTDIRSEEFYSLPFNLNKFFPSV